MKPVKQIIHPHVVFKTIDGERGNEYKQLSMIGTKILTRIARTNLPNQVLTVIESVTETDDPEHSIWNVRMTNI